MISILVSLVSIERTFKKFELARLVEIYYRLTHGTTDFTDLVDEALKYTDADGNEHLLAKEDQMIVIKTIYAYTFLVKGSCFSYAGMRFGSLGMPSGVPYTTNNNCDRMSMVVNVLM